MSDNDLGDFLRARREAVTPAEVGLPAGSRRRTPGLRRSELATLAGISVEYLTRLEQGRDRNPSPQVAVALGEALRLDADERVRLHRLCKGAVGRVSCKEAPPPAREVRPTVRALLARLGPAPAVLLNRLGDVLARTEGYELLAGPVGLLDGDPPNLLRYAFTDPRARSVYPDWDAVADALVGSLQLEFTREDPHVAGLVQDLVAVGGTPFADRVAAAASLPPRPGTERMIHPEAGELRLAAETLELPQIDDQRLVVHLPADDATAAALDRMAGRRPGSLRAVAG